jgi:hypothetical protein
MIPLRLGKQRNISSSKIAGHVITWLYYIAIDREVLKGAYTEEHKESVLYPGRVCVRGGRGKGSMRKGGVHQKDMPRRRLVACEFWYTLMRLPAPQNSEGLPEQVMEQSVAAASVLVLATAEPQ